ncbi:MAG: hypothetical protein HUK03_08800 [Bacteroidaceae bacterium]|nr:hypothetical protein [Bacteroidaceae bacterium]
MKKLAFVFAAVVAVSFASCGNKAQQTEEATDSVAVETIDSCCENDTCCSDTAACCQADSAAVVAE